MPIIETFSNRHSLAVINKYDQGAVMQISTVLVHVYHVACRTNGLLKQGFLDVYLTTFLESVTSKIQEL